MRVLRAAQQFFLSQRSVDHHLTSVFNKLGVDTRPRLWRWQLGRAWCSRGQREPSLAHAGGSAAVPERTCSGRIISIIETSSALQSTSGAGCA